jgi:hypothetical protein
MVRDTSLMAFKDIIHSLGDRQRKVYELFRHERARWCNQAIAYFLGWPINTVTPRVKELRDMGLLEDKGVEIYHATGRKVHFWGKP